MRDGARRVPRKAAALLGLILCPAVAAAGVPPEKRRLIERAAPAAAVVRPRAPRRLLVFDRNVGYGGHASIPYAAYAFRYMGETTGAYETVVGRDPEVFRAASLRRFDAVLLNNTVGNLFEDETLREDLRAFIYAGGGLLGYHGSSVAFQEWPGARETWPEFGRILGARGCAHRESDERVVLRIEDPGHPITAAFAGQEFELADEFFRFHAPYSRERVRVLLRIDTAKTDMREGRSFGETVRPDGDYAVSWVKEYGRGRVFYCAFGHNPYVFWDPEELRFWLAAIQFALGDLPAGTTPSARLTPAARARERLGWRLELVAPEADPPSFFQLVDAAGALGIRHVGGVEGQVVSAEDGRRLGPGLPAEAHARIRGKLEAADVRVVTWSVRSWPRAEEARRRLFAFGRAMGVEAFVAEPPPEALDAVDRLCEACDVAVAIRSRGAEGPPAYRRPADLLRALRGRSRLGACADIGAWIRSGIDPAAGVEALGACLLALRLPAPPPSDAGRREAPRGAATRTIREVLAALGRRGDAPVRIGLEYARGAGVEARRAILDAVACERAGAR